MKVIIVSGGFDPIHSGHISYLKAAKKLADHLVVAVNSDAWLVKKKGKAFMPFIERKEIIENLRSVDQVIDFPDDDLGSAIGALNKVKKLFYQSLNSETSPLIDSLASPKSILVFSLKNKGF